MRSLAARLALVSAPHCFASALSLSLQGDFIAYGNSDAIRRLPMADIALGINATYTHNSSRFLYAGRLCTKALSIALMMPMIATSILPNGASFALLFQHKSRVSATLINTQWEIRFRHSYQHGPTIKWRFHWWPTNIIAQRLKALEPRRHIRHDDSHFCQRLMPLDTLRLIFLSRMPYSRWYAFSLPLISFLYWASIAPIFRR